MGFPETLSWWEQGEKVFAHTLDGLSENDYDKPSLLPGWSRRKLLGHVARNAEALVNLLNWARSGVETPMYASPEDRERGIEETAKLALVELLADYRACAARLATAIKDLPEQAWANKVRTAQGREVPASEVPWMRCREVWIHAVDMDAGFGFEDIPSEILAALVSDVFQMWERRNVTPAIKVHAEGHTWGAGSLEVEGELAEIVRWLTGRGTSERIDAQIGSTQIPPWL
jgi:maleylpyruvate isomerase